MTLTQGYSPLTTLSLPIIFIIDTHIMLFSSLVSRHLRVAECIVMLLGQVAVEVKGQHGVIGTVAAIFQQRLFHPTSNLDGNIVIELGKMAAQTGVRCLSNVL